jgi:hypothetical protein
MTPYRARFVGGVMPVVGPDEYPPLGSQLSESALFFGYRNAGARAGRVRDA